MRKPAITVTVLLLVLTACGLFGGSNEDGSPRTIIFSAQVDDGTFQIYAMREDGSGIKQLTDGEFSSTGPAWSPDGTRIAYAHSIGSTAGEELWVMDADGSNKHPLVTNSRTQKPQLGTHPTWSPDGDKVAFDRCLNCELGGSNFEILVADLEAGTIDTLTHNKVLDMRPAWSQDGLRVAFTSNRNNPDQSGDVYIYNFDTGEVVRITMSGNAGRQIWAEKDKIIYWTNNQLYQVNLADSTTNEINVSISSEIGFRPLDFSPKEMSILLHTFNLNNPRQDQSLEKFYLSNNETIKVIKYSGFDGADWFTNN